jgi:hypothetical protein
MLHELLKTGYHILSSFKTIYLEVTSGRIQYNGCTPIKLHGTGIKYFYIVTKSKMPSSNIMNDTCCNFKTKSSL